MPVKGLRSNGRLPAIIPVHDSRFPSAGCISWLWHSVYHCRISRLNHPGTLIRSGANEFYTVLCTGLTGMGNYSTFLFLYHL